MTQQHPIPPPELVEQWALLPDDWNAVAFHIAQWGANQELEACCEWLDREGWSGESRQLRAARRPSLKGLALAQLDLMAQRAYKRNFAGFQDDAIRRALEQLPN